MAVERYGSKTDVIVKLVLVFFIALLSFSIGTFVGKKFSDNQHKLAQLEPNSRGMTAAMDGIETEVGEEARAVASVSPDANEVKPEKALTDDEIAKLAEEFVIDDEKAPAGAPTKLNDKNESGPVSAKNEVTGKEMEHAPAAAAVPVAAPAAKSAVPVKEAKAEPKAAVKAETLKPAQRLAEGKSAVVANPVVPPSRIPSSLPKEMASSALGKFTVQVASYGTEKEAQTMAADLKAKGFSAFYVSAKVKGTTWYRVSVGLFSTQKEADAYKKDLQTRAKISSAIVTKVSSAE